MTDITFSNSDIDNPYNYTLTDANIDRWNSLCEFEFDDELLICVPIFDLEQIRPSEIGQLVKISVAKYGLVPGEDYDRILDYNNRANIGTFKPFFRFKTLESFTIAALALK